MGSVGSGGRAVVGSKPSGAAPWRVERRDGATPSPYLRSRPAVRPIAHRLEDKPLSTYYRSDPISGRRDRIVQVAKCLGPGHGCRCGRRRGLGFRPVAPGLEEEPSREARGLADPSLPGPDGIAELLERLEVARYLPPRPRRRLGLAGLPGRLDLVDEGAGGERCRRSFDGREAGSRGRPPGRSASDRRDTGRRTEARRGRPCHTFRRSSCTERVGPPPGEPRRRALAGR